MITHRKYLRDCNKMFDLTIDGIDAPYNVFITDGKGLYDGNGMVEDIKIYSKDFPDSLKINPFTNSITTRYINPNYHDITFGVIGKNGQIIKKYSLFNSIFYVDPDSNDRGNMIVHFQYRVVNFMT